MIATRVFGILAMMFILVQTADAGGIDVVVEKYFSNTAREVEATTDVVQKRDIMNKSFNNVILVLDKVQNAPLISKEDHAGIDRFITAIQNKQNELMGINGFAPVPDAQLNAFSNYVVQDMQQASTTITISVVAALLIIVILILIL